MKTSFLTVAREGHSRLEVKHSRFLGYACHIADEDAAWERITCIRAQHQEARHHVFAFTLPQTERLSDDGEPSGTGGKPLLHALKNQGLEETLLVVTRYFGGILLGTGGLARAYGEAAVQALSEAGRAERRLHIPVALTVDYPSWGTVEFYLRERNLSFDPPQFTEAVRLTVMVPYQDLSPVHKDLRELTRGQIQAKQLEGRYLLCPLS